MITKRLLRVLIGIAGLLLSIVCFGTAITSENRQFLDLPIKERRESIGQYPLDKQVDLYLLAVLTKHPPDLGLADAVAKNGLKIVPFLTKRLVEEKREIAKMYLIDVFYRMQSLGFYAVASDKKTMALLDEQLSNITDPQWKRLSSELITKIRTGS